VDSRQPPPTLPKNRRLVHLNCTKCESPKAVVAATHYGELMCFCPACEHVWDCDDTILASREV